MSNSNGSSIGHMLKNLIIGLGKLIFLTIGFTCTMAGLVLSFVGKLFSKMSGYESGH